MDDLSKRSIDNMYGRVRKCLVLDKHTLEISKMNKTKVTTNESQSFQLSISIRYHVYKVISKNNITIKEW